ncbi:uncharacterized protein LOC113520151 [Galleria mellonella]|uniref:Uncharacterized protein LOC113520151 n=1 Tax=Galleria mellonella TaxID=7137 RepID=A0A6J1X522_GALME|nr:uncharacterized protein LOC113520151 [Galleria mellonella]
MYALLVIAVGLQQLVSADVSLGYHYKRPQNSGFSAISTGESPSYLSPSHGIPSYQVNSGSGQYSSGYIDATSNYYKGQGSNNLGLTNGHYNTFNKFQSESGYRGSGGYQPVNLLANNYYHNGLTSSSSLQTYPGDANKGFQTFNNQYYQSGQSQNSQQKYQQSYQVQQQPAQVFKHFYVHAAPEDDEPPKFRKPIVLPPPQKHYKIIFIKTPSVQQSAPQVVPIQQQNEEKTIVYVLVKKPENIQQDVVIPKVDQKPPAKPEVFFVKYNNKEDSQTVIDNIVKDYNKGQSVSFLNPSTSDSSKGISETFSSQTGQATVTPAGVQTLGLDSGLSGISTGFGSQSFEIVSGSTNNQNNAGTGTESFSLALNNESLQSQVTPDFGSSTFGSVDTQNQAIPVFGPSSLGIGSHTSALASTGTTTSSAVSNGYDNSASSSVTSSGVVDSNANANYDNLSTVPTSQGVPHETYGIPKFKV